MQAEFRTRLNHWSRRQQESSDRGELESGSIEISNVEGIAAASSGNADHVEGNSSQAVQINQVGSPARNAPEKILTESQKIAEGIAHKTPSPAANSLLESDDRLWYVRPPTGGQFGPASADLLKQWIDEGRVTVDSFVWCETWDNWKLAADVFPQIGGKVADEIFTGGNSDVVVAAKTRTAYLEARKRRTMWGAIVILAGSAVVVALLVVLNIVIQNRS